jgi:molybdate transport system substrate-binding protein
MKTKTRPVIYAFTLALSLIFGGAGCDSNDTSSAQTTASQTTAQSAETAQTTDQTTAQKEPPEQVELTVFAAASMTETLEEISKLYAVEAPNVKLILNFESSGTLKTQIEEGAECDLFISAGQRQMDQLDITASDAVNTDGLDFVAEGTRINLLENRVTLVTPSGNPKNINSFDDMASFLSAGQILMAMGNSDVPVGQYTQRILEFYGLDEASLAGAGSLSYGSNVKEVTTQVSEASVDCGVIYCTDAFSAGLDITDYATEEMCGRVIYPAAVIKSGKNSEAARAFLDYLTTSAAMSVFENVGFSKP